MNFIELTAATGKRFLYCLDTGTVIFDEGENIPARWVGPLCNELTAYGHPSESYKELKGILFTGRRG